MQDLQPDADLFKPLMRKWLEANPELHAKTLLLAQLPLSGLDPKSKAWMQVVDGRRSELGIAFDGLATAADCASDRADAAAVIVKQKTHKIGVDKVKLSRAKSCRVAAQDVLKVAEAREAACLQAVEFAKIAINEARVDHDSEVGKACQANADKEAALQKWLLGERQLLEANVKAARSTSPLPLRPAAVACLPTFETCLKDAACKHHTDSANAWGLVFKLILIASPFARDLRSQQNEMIVEWLAELKATPNAQTAKASAIPTPAAGAGLQQNWLIGKRFSYIYIYIYI